MMESILIVAIFGIIYGIAFFVAEYHESKYLKLHASLIAGISVAYFFLLVLPEIAQDLPEAPFSLDIFEYLFVLIGFIFIHISEKLILQKVEGKSQKRIRKLYAKEKILEQVEQNLENLINKQIIEDDFDELALKDMARVLRELKDQSDQIKNEIENYKLKIQKHINKDLNELRFFTDFIYYFLIGFILIGLLSSVSIVSGSLFFVFAWFRTLISHRSEVHLIFTDIEIYEKFEESKLKKIFLSSAALIGIILNLIFETMFPINLEILFLLFSFISGVILYTIVREVIPEREKGKPLYFIIGLVGFSIFIVILKMMEVILLF